MTRVCVHVAGCCLRTHAGDYAGWGVFFDKTSTLNEFGVPFEQTKTHAELSAIVYALKKAYADSIPRCIIVTQSQAAFNVIESLNNVGSNSVLSYDQTATLNAIRTLFNLAHRQNLQIEVRLGAKTKEYYEAFQLARIAAQLNMEPIVQYSSYVQMFNQ